MHDQDPIRIVMDSLSSHQTFQPQGNLPQSCPQSSTRHAFLWRLYPNNTAISHSKRHHDILSNHHHYIPTNDDFVYVRPKSVKEPGIIGRVVDIIGCATAELPTPPQPIIFSETGSSKTARISLLQSNGVIKHNVRVSRLVPIFDRAAQQRSPSSGNNTRSILHLLTPDTTNYRQLAVAHVRSDDKVLEIGCSYGACTALLLRRWMLLRLMDTACSPCTQKSGDSTRETSIGEDTTENSDRGVIVAFDTGSDMVEQTRQSLQAEFDLLSSVHTAPKQDDLERIYSKMITVHKVDAFADPKGAFSLATGNRKYPTVVLIDIGGNRELEGVARMIRWVQVAFSKHPPRVIIIKSKELTQELHSHLRDGIITDAQEWLIDFVHRTNSVSNMPWISQPPPSYPHPLQAPLVLSPKDGKTPICRFHNYHAEGCKRYNDECSECPLDHDYCHWCKRIGHAAKQCSG